MRTPHLALPLCLLAASVGGTVLAGELTPASVWRTDFATAQDEARALHRPLVVHFHTRWCQPCRKMEKEVLHTPQVLQQLDSGFVAVKIDLDKPANRQLQAQYKVETMPVDLVLSHDGKLLNRSEGYNGAQAGDKAKYLAALNKVDVTYTKEGKRLMRSAPAADRLVAGAAQPSATSEIARTDATGPNRPVPEPTEPRRLEAGDAPATQDDAAATAVRVLVGLDGYCPVTLRTTRAWKSGDQAVAHEHEGYTFYFLSSRERDDFKANPERFAPRLLGCDAVVLSESDQAVRGSTRFGAYYDGELFLFETAETRARFRKEPARYIRVKQVLKAEDIQDVRKLAGTVVK